MRRWKVVFAYYFQDYANFTVDGQIDLFRDLVDDARFDSSPTELGISYDGFSSSDRNQTRTILDLAMLVYDHNKQTQG
jgi:hypothetical protein